MSDFILEARDIVKTFPGVKALDGVDLQIKKGEVHALVGENGAGKSTLMLTLGGIHKPDSGTILMDGEEVIIHSAHDANLKGISIVFQELSLVPSLSIAENIFVNRQPIKRFNIINTIEMNVLTKNLLALFDLENVDPSTLVRDLSIANQQVVEILKAISFNPKVLILDEPTSSLTEHEVTQLFKNIRKLKDRGLSFIYISHHLNEIFQIADTVTVLRDGKHICDAKAEEIDEEYLIKNMVGRTITNMYGERTEEQKIGDVLFEVKELNKKNNFQNISFKIKSGEIVGMAGLVGAGRTELGRAVFGAEPPDSGKVYLNSKELKVTDPGEAIKQGIGYLSEDRKAQGLFLRFSVKENLIANHLRDFASKFGFLNEQKIMCFASKMKKDFRIATPSINRKTGTLSGGNQQKVLVGSWFGINPKVLIVDEPTRGVDVGAKSEIYQLLRDLAATGVGILMISSDLTEILGLSDRVLVMQNGNLVGNIPGNKATEENIIALAAGAANGRAYNDIH